MKLGMKGEVTMSYTHSFEDIRNRPVAVFGAGTAPSRLTRRPSPTKSPKKNCESRFRSTGRSTRSGRPSSTSVLQFCRSLAWPVPSPFGVGDKGRQKMPAFLLTAHKAR
jgi:hypothetical protein